MSYRSSVKTMIKKRYGAFAQEYGFWFHGKDLLVRINKDILHIISFDVLTHSFRCNIAIQPLYIPSDNITLSCGARLNYFKVRIPGSWGSGEAPDFEKDFNLIEDLITANVLPWFDEVGYPEGLAEFLQDEKRLRELTIGLPSWLRHIYLGFTLLYLRNSAAGVIELESALESLSQGNVAWVVRKRQIIQTMIDAASNPEEVRSKLNEFIQYSKVNIGITSQEASGSRVNILTKPEFEDISAMSYVQKQLVQFRDMQISRKELDDILQANAHEVKVDLPVELCSIHVIAVLRRYKNGLFSNTQLTEWVETMWYSEAFKWCNEHYDSVHSVIFALVELIEHDCLEDENERLPESYLEEYISALISNSDV